MPRQQTPSDVNPNKQLQCCQVTTAFEDELSVGEASFPARLDQAGSRFIVVSRTHEGGSAHVDVITLELPIDLGRSFSVTVKPPVPLQGVPAASLILITESNGDTNYSNAAGQTTRASVTIVLLHFPPVLFELHLPQRYPLFSAPIMIEVRGWPRSSSSRRARRSTREQRRREQMQLG